MANVEADPTSEQSAARPRPVERPDLFWRVLHLFCFVWFLLFYRFRSFGVHHVPLRGPVLMVSNHQSFLDPIVMGLPMSRRRFHALARKTLWNNRFVGWLISGLNAFPVDQESGSGDLKAMRTCIDILKRGEALLVFAEGARTLTGRTEKFETGTLLLIKRAKPLVVPVALEGPYDIWPRNVSRPKLWGRVAMRFGEPIPAEALLAMPGEAALELLRFRVEAMRVELAALNAAR